MAAEIGPVYLDRPVSAAELQPPELQPHGLADLVRQDEGSLVLDIQVARQRQGGLSLHLVTDDDHGCQVFPKAQLMVGKQRARGQREIPAAGLAPPAPPTTGPAAIVAGHAATAGAHRPAFRFHPADRRKGRFRLGVAHPQHRAQRDRPGGCREKEMLGHGRLATVIHDRGPTLPAGDSRVNCRSG